MGWKSSSLKLFKKDFWHFTKSFGTCEVDPISPYIMLSVPLSCLLELWYTFTIVSFDVPPFSFHSFKEKEKKVIRSPKSNKAYNNFTSLLLNWEWFNYAIFCCRTNTYKYYAIYFIIGHCRIWIQMNGGILRWCRKAYLYIILTRLNL